jgi:hypothetical protein
LRLSRTSPVSVGLARPDEWQIGRWLGKPGKLTPRWFEMALYGPPALESPEARSLDVPMASSIRRVVHQERTDVGQPPKLGLVFPEHGHGRKGHIGQPGHRGGVSQ